ncbi:MAG: hypothetical protein ACLFRT_06745 [Actinomycetota bacterium]
MAALGRILQIVGWLWLIIGLFGPMFGLISLNLLPGIILVFVARVIRNQADTREMPDLGEQPSVEEQQRSASTAETQPRRQAPPSPEPYVLETPSRREPSPEPPPDPKPAPRRRELLEEVVGLDPERDDDDASEKIPMSSDQMTDAEERRPMSSAEMIARAHERWDSKRR